MWVNKNAISFLEKNLKSIKLRILNSKYECILLNDT